MSPGFVTSSSSMASRTHCRSSSVCRQARTPRIKFVLSQIRVNTSINLFSTPTGCFVNTIIPAPFRIFDGSGTSRCLQPFRQTVPCWGSRYKIWCSQAKQRILKFSAILISFTPTEESSLALPSATVPVSKQSNSSISLSIKGHLTIICLAPPVPFGQYLQRIQNASTNLR